MAAGWAKVPERAGVKIPNIKFTAANIAVRIADQKPRRLTIALKLDAGLSVDVT